MSKGRKATPAELKDNDKYKDKSVIERQKLRTPKCDSAALRCPPTLSKGAKKEWRRVVKLYRELEMPVLNDLDIAVLTAYCAEVDIAQRLYDEWAKGLGGSEEFSIVTKAVSTSEKTEKKPSGEAVKSTSGSSAKNIVNPLLREYNRHIQTVRILAEQLALTPAGRAAYAVRQEKKSRSEAEDFMED